MFERLKGILPAYFAHRSGSVATTLGLLFPIAAGAAVFAVDHVAVTQQQAALQRAADAAALATARQLRFVREANQSQSQEKQTSGQLSAIADAVARKHVAKTVNQLKAEATRLANDTISVTLTHQPDAPFGTLTGLSDGQLSAKATAELFGARNICIIAFEDGDQVGINLENSARIEAGDCGIYSNAKNKTSVISKNDAYIGSEFVCSAGGFEGGESNFSTRVTTDCPAMEDPLASRPLPTAPATCDETNLVISDDQGMHTLQPGHYCGGLIIQNQANVQMNPGTYIISGGPLLVKNEARLTGVRVGIVMDDANGNVLFENEAEVELSAPTTGPLAGLVISSRSVCGGKTCHGRIFQIKSPKVRSLLGTIYVPEDRFIIDTTMPVSKEAAFTIILARFVQGKQAPTLVLNTNYEATDVPVPDGFIGSDGIRLID